MDHITNVTVFTKKENRSVDGIPRTFDKFLANENILKSISLSILDPRNVDSLILDDLAVKTDQAFCDAVKKVFSNINKALRPLELEEASVKDGVKKLLSANSFTFRMDYSTFVLSFDIDNQLSLCTGIADADLLIFTKLLQAIFIRSMKYHMNNSLCGNETNMDLLELKWVCIQYVAMMSKLNQIPNVRMLMFACSTPNVVLLRILAVGIFNALSPTVKNKYQSGEGFESIEGPEGNQRASFIGFDGRKNFIRSEFRRYVRLVNTRGQELDLPDFADDNQ